MVSLTEIAEQIGEGIDFLEADLRDLPARQRSLRAVFDRSWGLLPEPQKGVLQELSVFRGGFTRQAAQEVTGASLTDLMVLVNRSPLTRSVEGRYEVHELLRQYAAERLDQSPDAGEPAHQRHSCYYTGVLHRWWEHLKGPRQLTALAEMDVEIENARAALGMDGGKGEAGARWTGPGGTVLVLPMARALRCWSEGVRAGGR